MAQNYTADAYAALLAAHAEVHDFGEWLTNLVAAVATKVGGTHQLLAGRPGSWESAAIAAWMESAGVGPDDVAMHAVTVAELDRATGWPVAVRHPRRWWSPGIKEALERLRDRYQKAGNYLDETSASRDIAFHLDPVYGRGYQPPTVADVMDALTLVWPAREGFKLSIDSAELDLIDAAHQAGQSWGAIGEALGYDPAGAAVTAKSRYRTLLGKFPSRKPRTVTVDINNGTLTSSDTETTAESPATGQ